MSQTLIQITDHEFKEILSDAFKEGAKLARELLTSKPPQEWVSEPEALELLHIKKSTIDKWRHDRRIDYRGGRGHLQYSMKSILVILDERTVRAV